MGNIEKLLEMLPEGYEKAANETGALKRAREIKTAFDLLMLVFLYVAHGLWGCNKSTKKAALRRKNKAAFKIIRGKNGKGMI